jgi:hypothetical protein
VRASFDLHAATPTIAVTTGRSVRVTPDRLSALRDLVMTTALTCLSAR